MFAIGKFEDPFPIVLKFSDYAINNICLEICKESTTFGP